MLAGLLAVPTRAHEYAHTCIHDTMELRIRARHATERELAYKRSYTHAYLQVYANTHTRFLLRAYMKARRCTHMHAHARTCTHMHADTFNHAHAWACERIFT